MIPFIYFFALFMQYETLFIRLSIRISKNRKLFRYAKFQIFKVSLFNLKKLSHFAKVVPVYNFDSKEEICNAIQVYNNSIKQKSKL